MITGAGTPLLDLITDAQAAGADARKAVLYASLPARNDDNKKADDRSAENRLADLVEISDEALARLDNRNKALAGLEKGRGELVRQEARQLGERLAQIREEIDQLRSLLQEADGLEQSRPILRGIQETAKTLRNIAHQLGLLQRTEESAGNQEVLQTGVTVESVQLTASFNQVALTADETGNFVLAQLSSVSDAGFKVVAKAANNDFNRQVIQDFQKTLRSFSQLVEEFAENIDSEDRIPPSIFRMIKDLLAANVNPDQNHKIDELA